MNFTTTYDDNNEIKVDVNHVYYFQVQGSIAITNTWFCDDYQINGACHDKF